MSSIVVTGAAGFIGSHTIEAFLAAGYSVVGVDNFRTGRRENLARAQATEGFTFYEMDVLAPSGLSEICLAHQPAAIVHLAALVSVPESFDNPMLNFRLNIETTQVVIEAARKSSVKRVVYASSAAVYGDAGPGRVGEDAHTQPMSPYGAAKLASEKLLLGCSTAFGFAVHCLRYFNVYGLRQDPKSCYSGVISKFAGNLLAGIPFKIDGDGCQTRDFIHVQDVARANLLSATVPHLKSGVANICTGMPISINEVAKVIAERAGVTVVLRHGSARIGDIRESCGDPARAKMEFGFSARTDFHSNVGELVAVAPRGA